MSRKITVLIAMIATATIATGCMPKMSLEEMKAMTPKKPAELERLNDFVGKWKAEGTATMAMLEEPVSFSGTMETKWEGDGWFTVGRGVMQMADFDKMSAMETWTYDSHSKVYRSQWVDGMGTMGNGTAKYDDDSRSWRMKATGHGPFGKSSMKGTLNFVDDDTMEWTWTEYMGLMKTMEMSGTSKRQK